MLVDLGSAATSELSVADDGHGARVTLWERPDLIEYENQSPIDSLLQSRSLPLFSVFAKAENDRESI